MNPDQRALLNNVIANPDDDVARLVYADWLEEFGDDDDKERAKLIHDMMGVKDIPLGWVWVKDRDLPVKALHHRGFAHTIRCRMSAWLKHGPAICEQHPIERVEISGKSPMEWRRHPCWTWAIIAADWAEDFPDIHEAASVIPAEVVETTRTPVFETEQQANDWLSSCLIKWARSQTPLLTSADSPDGGTL